MWFQRFDIAALTKRLTATAASAATEKIEPVAEDVEEFLLVRIGSMGWWCQRCNLQGIPVGAVATGALLTLEPQQGSPRLQQVIRSFIDQGLNARRWASTRMILLLEGGSQVCFSDGLGENLIKASKGAIREFGRTLLNQPDVSFGFETQLKTLSGAGSGGIHAFAGVPFIKECLDAFDRKGLHLYRMVPIEYALLHRLQESTETSCAALHVGAFETALLMCHPVLGARTVQHLPFGVMALVAVLKKKKRLSDQQALVMLASAESWPGQPSYSMPAEIIDAFAQLANSINRALDYFEQQRICGRPEFMELHGEFARIHGFSDWLQSQINLMVRIPDPDRNLEAIFVSAMPELRFSLLQGLLEGTCILQVANVRYTMTKEGILSIRNLENTRIINQGLDARLAEDRHKARRLVRRKESQSRRREMINNLRQGLAEWLSKRSTGSTHKEVLYEWLQQHQPRIVALAVAALVLTGGYQFHQGLKTDHDQLLAAQTSRAEKRKTLTTNISKLDKETKGMSGASVASPGFVRWSEKLTRLGTLMESNMWVNGMSLTVRPSAQEKWSGYLVELSIDAGLKKRAEVTHIMDITQFTERLQSDTDRFMIGFDQVAMNNTRSENKGNEDTFQFSLSVVGHDPALAKIAK